MRGAEPPRWTGDPCPPYPLVVRGEVLLPAAVAPVGPALLGDVHAVARLPPGPAGARARAMAAAMCTSVGAGVLARRTAAWVWTGAPDLVPDVLDLAQPPGAPTLPGPPPRRPRRPITTRQLQPVDGTAWVMLGPVGVLGPEATASDCARTLPPVLAHRCLEQLRRHAHLDLDVVVALLSAGPSRPGRSRALALVRELGSG